MVEDKEMGKDSRLIKNDGGSAFPGAGYSSYTAGGYSGSGGGGGGGFTQPGMSLRDYFAAKVLQGSQANSECNHWSSLQHVEYAYEVADAMLEARK